MAASKKSFLDGLLYFINTIAAFALMASYLSNYINPNLVTWFSILALAYPYLLVTNIVFAIWWALRLKLKIILPIVAIALGYKQIPLLYKSHGTNQVVASGTALKIMSYNVHNLNRYRWLDDDSIPQKISTLVREEDPQLLITQEFRPGAEGWEVDYPYQSPLADGKQSYLRNMVFSKLPILEHGYYELPGPDGAVNNGKAFWCDIEWQDKRIRVINLHLSSVGLDPADYESLSDFEQTDQNQIQKNLYKIGGSLSSAFRKRAYQVEYLDSVLGSLDMPLIVAGDFNDPPYSFTYHHLNKHLEDSYVAAGEGWVKTFDRKPLALRIDYILYSERFFRCHEYRVIEKQLSDHYPVIAEISWR